MMPMRRWPRSSGFSLAPLSLALWTVLLFYNVTESAFRGSQLMWVVFLVGAIFISQLARKPVSSVPAANFAPIQPLPLQPRTLER